MTAAIHAHDPANNLRGILAMVVAMASFVLNDAFVKLAAATLPTGEVIFLRAIGTAAICFGLILARDAPRVLAQALQPRVMLRALGDVGGAFTFIFALTNMPIADAYAILQFTPLALTAGAAVFLGAKVGWRRWSAAAVGLIGVLVIVRPGGAAFNGWALLALFSICFAVTRDLVTRAIGLNVSSLAMAFTSTLFVGVASLGFLFFESWRLPGMREMLLIAGACLTLLGGQHWLIFALRTGEITAVAPFRYSIVLWSVLAGIAIWHEVPDKMTFVGMAIVIGAGLYTFLREQKLSKAARS